MKTPDQWLEIINQRGATTQPAGTLKLIADIQDDAIEEASLIVLSYKYRKRSINYNMGFLAGNILMKHSKNTAAMPNGTSSPTAEGRQW